jgi:hypothetical protein
MPPPADRAPTGHIPGFGTVTTARTTTWSPLPARPTHEERLGNDGYIRGATLTTAIQNALNSLTQGRTVKQTVLLQGTFSYHQGDQHPSYTILKIDGMVEWGVVIGRLHTDGEQQETTFEVSGGEWGGNRGHEVHDVPSSNRCTSKVCRT